MKVIKNRVGVHSPYFISLKPGEILPVDDPMAVRFLGETTGNYFYYNTETGTTYVYPYAVTLNWVEDELTPRGEDS